MTNSKPTRIRKIVILVLVIIGLLFVGLSLAADYLRLDLTPGFGIIQMVALLAGLTLLTLASYLYIYSIRPKDAPNSLQADIGTRLGATGLVFAYVTGLSDLIGIGTHVDPNFERPFVGPLQLGGLAFGVIMIASGLILYYTSRGPRGSSSLEFLLNWRKKSEESEHQPERSANNST